MVVVVVVGGVVVARPSFWLAGLPLPSANAAAALVPNSDFRLSLYTSNLRHSLRLNCSIIARQIAPCVAILCVVRRGAALLNRSLRSIIIDSTTVQSCSAF